MTTEPDRPTIYDREDVTALVNAKNELVRENARLLAERKRLHFIVEFARSRFCDPENLEDDPAAVRLKEMADAALAENPS